MLARTIYAHLHLIYKLIYPHNLIFDKLNTTTNTLSSNTGERVSYICKYHN